jgi:hypothetical protein
MEIGAQKMGALMYKLLGAFALYAVVILIIFHILLWFTVNV